MKSQIQIKRQTIILVFLGSLFISFTLLTRHFFETPVDIADFLTGLGVAFMLSALYVQNKLEKKTQR
jgi:glycopeptide antibiotics resistance protein